MDSNESSRKQKRKKGGQPGNQNARTHGLYSKHLSPEDHRLLQAATGVSGLDYEIALLRAKILSILAGEPGNNEELLLAARAFIKLLKAKDKIARPKHEELNKALENALRGLTLPVMLKKRLGGLVAGARLEWEESPRLPRPPAASSQ